MHDALGPGRATSDREGHLMTQRTALSPSPRRVARSAAHPATPRLDRRMAVLAGAGLVLIAVLGAFAYLGVVDGLVIDGDAAGTATQIDGSRGLFALGVAALYLAALLDIVVAWALLRLLRPVDEPLARLAA